MAIHIKPVGEDKVKVIIRDERKIKTKSMTLRDLLEYNEKARALQNTLSIEDQIEVLKQHKKSVFTFHMLDGRKIVSGDSESDRKEMEEFFKAYPQTGCKWVEFHK